MDYRDTNNKSRIWENLMGKEINIGGISLAIDDTVVTFGVGYEFDSLDYDEVNELLQFLKNAKPIIKQNEATAKSLHLDALKKKQQAIAEEIAEIERNQ